MDLKPSNEKLRWLLPRKLPLVPSRVSGSGGGGCVSRSTDPTACPFVDNTTNDFFVDIINDICLCCQNFGVCVSTILDVHVRAGPGDSFGNGNIQK